MEEYILTDQLLGDYWIWLRQNEKSEGTIQIYQHYLRQFQIYAGGQSISKELVLNWKESLKKVMAPVTVNGALAAVNGFFRYAGWDFCVVRLIKICRQVFCSKKRELSQDEYLRLVQRASEEGNERLAMILQTICSTGIRISELSFVTTEAAVRGYAEVDCKGKYRRIYISKRLCQTLQEYAGRHQIEKGVIFITRSGKPVDRSNIWREMKELAKQTGIDEEKVFPHNLRHLFAREYYSLDKDLVKLSDILGHSNINTTRIYTVESGENHVRQLERLNLVL